MGPEREKGGAPTYVMFKIEKGIAKPGEPAQTLEIPVEISPDGNTYTATVTINGITAVGTAEKTNISSPGDAVADALNKIDKISPDEDDAWFVSA